MTVEQVAEALGLRPASVRQKIWRRELEFVKVGRAVRFRPEAVERLIEQGVHPPLERQ